MCTACQLISHDALPLQLLLPLFELSVDVLTDARLF